MQRRWMAGLAFGMFVTVATLHGQQASGGPGGAAPKTEKELRSYALGADLGTQLRKLSVEVDPAVFARGLADALAGGKTSMTDDEVKAAISRLQSDLKAKQLQTTTGKEPSK